MTQKLSENGYKNKITYINNYNKKVIECECGSKTIYGHLPRHKKTKKHIKFITEK